MPELTLKDTLIAMTALITTTGSASLLLAETGDSFITEASDNIILE